MKTHFKETVLFLMTTLLLYSCQKEATSLHENESTCVIQIENDTIYDNDCKVKPDDIWARESRSAVHSTPSIISQLAANPDYGDYFSFNSLYHDCSLDTAGYYLYVVPSKYWPNQSLSLVVEADTILMSYSVLFPSNFDWDYCYNNHEYVPIYACFYEDSENFFEGMYNPYYGTLIVTWVNPNLYDSKKMRPGWETFCGYWTVGGYVCAQLFSLACPLAGAVVATTACVICTVKCL